MSAGPRSTTNMAGKIRKTRGKRILIGAFCARSSAFALRRRRISVARSRRICPIETPSVSPWTIERTNERMDGVSQRAIVFASASLIERAAREEADEGDDRRLRRRRREPDPDQRQADRREDPVPEELRHGDAVHAGRGELAADLVALAEPADEALADAVRGAVEQAADRDLRPVAAPLREAVALDLRHGRSAAQVRVRDRAGEERR